MKRPTPAFNHVLDPEPQQAILDQLLVHNPRAIRKLLQLAFGFAAVENCSHLTGEDIKCARSILDRRQVKSSVGFS